MPNTKLTNFLLIVCILTVACGTFFIVKSMDLLRFEIEKLHLALKDGKIMTASAAPQKNDAPLKSGEIANAEFFDPNAQSGGRFITVSASDTKNMNDLITNDAFLSTIGSFVQDSLAARNNKDIGKFQPQLAESWERSEDGLRFRIKLRKGILWHDFTDPVTGKEWKDVELTAEDFKFYVEVVKNEKVDCAPMRTYLNDLDHIEIHNKYEFTVVWKTPYFLSEEITLQLPPLARHLYHAYEGPFDPAKFNEDHERNRIMIGTGPYSFDRWDKGRRILLKKWEKYYGKDYGVMPPLDTVAIEIIQHPATSLQAAVSKDVDETNLTPDQWINRTSGPEFDEKTGWLRKLSTPSLAYNYIGFNLKNPCFKDTATRVALSHLVNRDRIIKDVYYGQARIVTGPFFPDSPANDTTLPVRSFDPELAANLLEKAGWRDSDGDGVRERNGVKLEFTLIYPNANPVYGRLLPMIRQDMVKAGVRMNLLGLEWSVCVQRLEKKSFDACAMGWQGGISPDPYQLWHSSQADVESSSNFIGFKNPEADKLIEEIRVTFDAEKRNELYHKFHKLIYDEAPYIFMVSPYSLSALSSRYQNLQIFPLGYPTRILWTPAAEQLQVPGL